MQSCNRFERKILGNILIDIDFSQYSCLAPSFSLVTEILEELGYLDEKKKEDKKENVHEEGDMKEDTGKAGEREQK